MAVQESFDQAANVAAADRISATSVVLEPGAEKLDTHPVKNAAQASEPRGSNVTRAGEAIDESVTMMIEERMKELCNKNKPSLRVRELSKKQRKKLKELDRLMCDKSLQPEERAKSLYQVAVDAVNDHLTASKEAVQSDSERQTAVRELAEREEQLQLRTTQLATLREVCSELQKQLKQAKALHNEEICAEAEKRKAAVEKMGSMVEGITTRLNQQHSQMEIQCAENRELREKLKKVSEVVRLSETLRSKYEEECGRLTSELGAKGDLAEKALHQLQQADSRHQDTVTHVAQLQSALKSASETLKGCHKANSALESEKKELLSLNSTLREECTKATSLASSLADQCQEKEIQIKKLQLAVSRLEGVGRCLQLKVQKQNAQLEEHCSHSTPNAPDAVVQEWLQVPAESELAAVTSS